MKEKKNRTCQVNYCLGLRNPCRGSSSLSGCVGYYLCSQTSTLTDLPRGESCRGSRQEQQRARQLIQCYARCRARPPERYGKAQVRKNDRCGAPKTGDQTPVESVSTTWDLAAPKSTRAFAGKEDRKIFFVAFCSCCLSHMGGNPPTFCTECITILVEVRI